MHRFVRKRRKRHAHQGFGTRPRHQGTVKCRRRRLEGLRQRLLNRFRRTGFPFPARHFPVKRGRHRDGALHGFLQPHPCHRKDFAPGSIKKRHVRRDGTHRPPANRHFTPRSDAAPIQDESVNGHGEPRRIRRSFPREPRKHRLQCAVNQGRRNEHRSLTEGYREGQPCRNDVSLHPKAFDAFEDPRVVKSHAGQPDVKIVRRHRATQRLFIKRTLYRYPIRRNGARDDVRQPSVRHRWTRLQGDFSGVTHVRAHAVKGTFRENQGFQNVEVPDFKRLFRRCHGARRRSRGFHKARGRIPDAAFDAVPREPRNTHGIKFVHPRVERPGRFPSQKGIHGLRGKKRCRFRRRLGPTALFVPNVVRKRPVARYHRPQSRNGPAVCRELQVILFPSVHPVAAPQEPRHRTVPVLCFQRRLDVARQNGMRPHFGKARDAGVHGGRYRVFKLNGFPKIAPPIRRIKQRFDLPCHGRNEGFRGRRANALDAMQEVRLEPL